MSNQSGSEHPLDTPLSSGLRSLAEVLGWVACTWAAARESPWLAILVFVILIGLPTFFSTPGDKKQTIVATPGPLRVLLELVLFGVMVACFWKVWPAWLAVVSTILVVAAILAGILRTRWLLAGAPSMPDRNV